jgi:hypothetical protein
MYFVRGYIITKKTGVVFHVFQLAAERSMYATLFI